MPADWFATEAKRVLKPNGLLVGVFANRWSLRGYFHHVMARFRNRFDFYRMPYARWRDEIERIGFRLRFEEGICWFPFSRDSDSRLVAACTRIEALIGLRRLPLISPWIVLIAQRNPS